MNDMIGKTISHYRIVEEVGRGGMGIVYRAHDTKLDRDVALKFLPRDISPSPEERDRFIHEAKAASSLDHPNICTVYEVDETHDGQMFISMGFYDGIPLSRKIEKGCLEVSEAVWIAIQIAEGLQAAHEKGIIHRDIKSSNVIITDKGQVKILDFGLAHKRGLTKLTRTGSTLGTASYMSPEQARGETIDHRSDLWSLGVVLYEMVTGKLPFRGDHEPAILYSVVNEEPQPIQASLPDTSPELVHILRWTLEKDPAERYQSAQDLSVDLKRLKKDTSKIGFPPVMGGSKKLAAGRKRNHFIAGALTLLIAIGYLLFRPAPAEISGKRIAVAVFENKTGDSSMDGLGPLITETVTQGLVNLDSFKIVSSDAAIRQWKVLTAMSQKNESLDILRTFAQTTGAGIVVSGAYDKEGDILKIHANVTDAISGKLLRIIGPIEGHISNRNAIYEEVRNRAMGGIATFYDKNFVYYRDMPSYTLRYESYHEFMVGWDLFVSHKWESSLEHFREASKIDSSIFLYQILQSYAYGNAYENHKCDSILQKLEKGRASLTRTEILILEQTQSGLKGDHATRFNLLKDLIAIWPEIWGHDYGFTALCLNRLSDAIYGFAKFDTSRLRGLNPFFYWPHLTTAYHGLKQHEQELKAAQELMQMQPNVLRSAMYEMNALIALGRLNEFWKRYDEASTLTGERDFNQGELIVSCSDELRAHGHLDASREAVEKGIAWYTSRPDSESQQAENQFGLARAYYFGGYFDKAAERYRLLLKRDPKSITALGRLGAIAARMGRLTEAFKIGETLKNIKRPYLYGYHTKWRAKIASLLGDKEKALVLLRESLGQGQWYTDLHADMDLEPLKDYPPFEELMKPKQ